jgi:hypothetical protein
MTGEVFMAVWEGAARPQNGGEVDVVMRRRAVREGEEFHHPDVQQAGEPHPLHVQGLLQERIPVGADEAELHAADLPNAISGPRT